MSKSVLIPLNNVYAKGDFCAEIEIGTPPQRQNMIVDSGSSTFAVAATHYQASADSDLQPTQLCQHVAYGIGAWVGPVVKTSGKLGHGSHAVVVTDINVAIAETQMSDTFMHATGILGLAYNALNIGHDMKQDTYPWAPRWHEEAQQKDFVSVLQAKPAQHLSPLFDTCTEQGVIPDKFAFLVHRSSIFNTKNSCTAAELASHPLNRGLLALGNPHLHTHIHQPQYQTVPLVCDTYYNVDLLSVKVGMRDSHEPPAFEPNHKAKHNSNCFFDSGASFIILPPTLFSEVLDDLKRCVPDQANLLEPYQQYNGKEVGIPIEQLDLEQWPDIVFTFKGENGQDVLLSLSPHSYWQTHAPVSNQASFKISTLPGWKPQTIMGLPIFCEYYTIFDRQAGEKGHLVFAQPNIAPHKFADSMHNNWEHMKQSCQHLIHSQ